MDNNKDEQLNKESVESNDIVDPTGSDMEAKKTDYGLIKPRILEQEMQESYLDYAMSVIVARALPDVRDGLKPVHRKILYSMHELGLSSRAKYRKSATVVGDVLGKYHPHGDIAVYDSLVRMAQPFSMRYRLVDGQGNFGSMDGDSAAAMRYTEARMTAISEEMLADIDKNTVDFSPNYDGSIEEPQVLPSKVPQLLLNGSLGIAVGMATNIPPHNLGELCDGVIAFIDNPDISIDELLEYIPGPDFPTGANIYNYEEIKTAYTTGRGHIIVRASAAIEESNRGFRIIISELPYQVNKAELISKIADHVKEKRIEGISDLRDESDRKEGVRIVVDLKSNAYPKKILNRLYELTLLQTAYHFNMLALVNGIEPRILNLKNILEEYLKHRQLVVRRRTQFELDQAKDRAHILEGLKKALEHIDEIIALIKKSETKEIAHKELQKQFRLSEKQATAILEMRLAQLAGLERKKIDDELKEKLELIKNLESILASKEEILSIIKAELNYVKEKFSDPRRTKIHKSQLGQFTAEDLIPNEQVIVSLTKTNYVKRVPVAVYRSQGRGGKGVIGMETKDEDSVEHLLTCYTHDDIMFFTDKGRVFTAKVYDLPPSSRTAKGQAIVNIIQIAPDEKVTAILTIAYDKKEEKPQFFFLATKRGVVKKTQVSLYLNVRKTGLIAIKLNQEDELKWVIGSSGQDNIIMVTRKGQAILFNEKDVRAMGRSAAGVRGIKLRSADEVIAMDVVKNPLLELITISENGIGKKTRISQFGVQRRGGIGLRAAKVSARTGNIVEAFTILGDTKGDLAIISSHGQVIRLPLKSVKRLGRDTQGVTLMRLNKGDKVTSMTFITKEDEIIPNPTAEVVEKMISLREVENKNGNKAKKEDNIKKDNLTSSTKETKQTKIEEKITNKETPEKINNKKPTQNPKEQSSRNAQNKISFQKPNLKVNHYQNNPSNKNDKSEPNYWGADLWSKKK